MPRIRRAEHRDAVAIAALLGELGYPTDMDAATGRLGSLLSRQDYAVLVAEQDQRVVGLGSVHVLPLLHAGGSLGLITALVVSEAARGGGVGRQLALRIEEFARSQGCTRVIVTTANHRGTAHAFYEQIGYEHTGRRYARTLPMEGESAD